MRTSGGTFVRIQQQPLQVLHLLLEAQGRVVTREALRIALWSGAFVDFEHAVNTAVKTLRQALGDSVDEPKFIETMPKVGYRFLVPVEWGNDPNERQAQHSILSMLARETSVDQTEPYGRRHLRRAVLIVSPAALGILLSLLLYHSQ